jgi:hypothetical protein
MATIPKVPVRSLGSQGLKTSQLGLGAMGFSSSYTKDPGLPKFTHCAADRLLLTLPITNAFVGHCAVTEEASIEVIHRALALGVTMIDAADVYGPYTNETLIGQSYSFAVSRPFASAFHCQVLYLRKVMEKDFVMSCFYVRMHCPNVSGHTDNL